jgi:lipopolysaccharide biosynthesis protein
VATAGFEPLSHFLRLGKVEGRLPQASNQFRSVDEASLLCLKAPSPRETMALFACHAPGGRIKPHVRPFLEALAGQGVATTLIVAADEIQSVDGRELLDAVDGLFVRQAQGYDFAAWARIARDLDMSHTRCLGLVNDSIIGPLNAESFSVVFDRIRASRAHLVGLTDSLQITHHLQSYFLIAKGEGVPALRDFLAGVKAYDCKEEVIINYEVPLLRRFREANLTAEALFPSSTGGDETTARWRELIQRGFPFVKARALRQPGAEDWRRILSEQGYDARIVEQTLAIIEQNDARPAQSPPPQA